MTTSIKITKLPNPKDYLTFASLDTLTDEITFLDKVDLIVDDKISVHCETDGAENIKVVCHCA